MIGALLRTLRTPLRDYAGLARLTYRWYIRPAYKPFSRLASLPVLWPPWQRRLPAWDGDSYIFKSARKAYWANRRNTDTVGLLQVSRDDYAAVQRASALAVGKAYRAYCEAQAEFPSETAAEISRNIAEAKRELMPTAAEAETALNEWREDYRKAMRDFRQAKREVDGC